MPIVREGSPRVQKHRCTPPSVDDHQEGAIWVCWQCMKVYELRLITDETFGQSYLRWCRRWLGVSRWQRAALNKMHPGMGY